ncbi:MAG: inositol monophosphatase family protein [Alphaproteobacteria bacterium]
MKIDTAAVEKIIKEVAATEIMPRFKNLVAGDIETKADKSSVTVADKAAEAALIVSLTAAFPGSVVVGEESFAKDPLILSHFGGEEDVWVIDPIDGTRNFISGNPEFAVMIALMRRKQTIGAWIHDPNSGDTLMAELGGGVWLRNHKMRLAGQDPTVPTIGLAGWQLRKFLARPEIAATIPGFPPLEPSSAAAFDYARLFTGDELFAKSLFPRASFLVTYRHAMPWDHLSGLMMLNEAGGYSADWSGQPYVAETPNKGLMSTADRPTWDRLHALLKAPFMSPDVP